MKRKSIAQLCALCSSFNFAFRNFLQIPMPYQKYVVSRNAVHFTSNGLLQGAVSAPMLSLNPCSWVGAGWGYWPICSTTSKLLPFPPHNNIVLKHIYMLLDCSIKVSQHTLLALVFIPSHDLRLNH